MLPADETAYGFDNIASALGVSSPLLERYMAAASRITTQIGELAATCASDIRAQIEALAVQGMVTPDRPPETRA